MRGVEKRAIERQHRILRRAVRRGEKTREELAKYELEHAAVLNLAPPPDDPSQTPFRTRDGHKLPISGVYAGCPVFLILSGPSIATLDLSLLRRRGVVTFGVNNSPSVFRPNFWTFVDKPMKFHDAIWRDPYVVKFVPTRHYRKSLREKKDGVFSIIHGHTASGARYQVNCGDMPGVIGYERNADFIPERWLSEPTVNWGNSLKSANRNKNLRCLNTMFAVLKIAYAIGFRVVYLLGCDFKMSAERPYGFDQGGDDGKAASNNNCYAVMQTMFSQLKPHFDAAGFHVFNCTPESGLTVFPFVSYHDAIASATRHIPQDPLDVANWYD